MDKNQQNKDDTYKAPDDEIQAKITELMGLPADEAPARVTKEELARQIIKPKDIKPLDDNQNSEQPKPDEAVADELNKIVKIDIESDATDKAVTEIVQSESDEILKQQDDKVADFKIEPKAKRGLGRYVSVLWRNKKVRYALLLITALSVSILIFIPGTRYAALNAAGVRSSASFKVVDKISGRPVKNVDVKLADQQSKTGDDGTVTLYGLKLGESQLELTKRSFEPMQQTITIGWGSNPFISPFEVVPTGTTFKFTITDWIDGAALKEAEITDGDSVGIANEDGLAEITIEPTDDDIAINVSAKGYRQEEVVIPANSTAPLDVKLTSSKPDVFITKRSGKYDLYKRDIDGKNEILVLPATGNENSDIYALGHPTDYNTAVLVSSREGIRNDDGFMFSNLYIVNLKDKTAAKVESTQSERIRVVGWSGDKLVFVKTISGPSASLGNRQRIIVYDYKKKEQKELASANYFIDARLINGELYYVVSSGVQGSQGPGLGKIDLQGNNRRVLIGDSIWGIYRTSNQALVVNSEGEKWYSINLSNNSINELSGPPAQIQDIVYFENPSKQALGRVEKRDGKTEILVTTADSNKDSLVIRQTGISLPIEWINDKTIIYGVVTSEETARYVVSLTNNKAIKIGDNTASIYDGVPYY